MSEIMRASFIGSTMQVSLHHNIGKNKLLGGIWVTKDISLDELIEHSYKNHKAFTPALLKIPHEKVPSNRRREFWRGNNIVVVDIDYKDLNEEQHALATIPNFLNNEFIRKHCFAIIPSSSYIPDQKHAWHLVFQFNATIIHWEFFRSLYNYFLEKIGLSLDKATFTPVQYIAGTLWKNLNTDEYPDYFVYKNLSAELIDVDDLPVYVVDKVTPVAQYELVVKTDDTAVNSKIAKKHKAQLPEHQEKVTLEALDYFLESLEDKTRLPYEIWFQLWTSAHDGFMGQSVVDTLMNTPKLYWESIKHKHDFQKAFYEHKRREDGYTVASLFWLAKKKGWLSTSPYDVEHVKTRDIHEEDIADWFLTHDFPKQFLLQSQTGTGKTQSIPVIWEKLGRPKTVVLVPTTKLAQELAYSMNRAGVPAFCYFDEETKMPYPSDFLRDKYFLVSTLQTFIKVAKNKTELALWDLIIFEEADQLLRQFAVGGHTFYGNHINDITALKAFRLISWAFEMDKHIIGLDATMTSVAYVVFSIFANKPISFIKNTFVRTKPSVVFVDNFYETLQIAVNAYRAKKRLVFCVDTAKKAEEIRDIVKSILPEAKQLLITRRYGATKEVIAFMNNPDVEASKYDVIIYNSAIASGVSIVDVKAEVLIQISHFLSPRVHLQMLNRFRRQGDVYIYYDVQDDLYSYYDMPEKYIRDFYIQELKNVGLDTSYQNKDFISHVRYKVANIVIADELFQKRSPFVFYQNLLKKDGRQVKFMNIEVNKNLADILNQYYDMLKDKKSKQQEFVRANWRRYEPMQYFFIDETKTQEEIFCSLAHYQIKKFFNDNIPENILDEKIFDIYKNFHNKKFNLFLLLKNTDVVENATRDLMSEYVPISSIKYVFSKIKIFDILKIIFSNFENTRIDKDDFEKYLNMFLMNQQLYDACVSRKKRTKYIFENDSKKLFRRFLRNVLDLLGLKIKTCRDGSLEIKNAEDFKVVLESFNVKLVF